MMDKLEVSARMTVRKGQLEGFRRQAAEIIRQTKDKDTKTLRYEWFLNGDETACEVREAYEDSEGLIEHQMHVGEALHELFERFADDHAVTIYGEPSRELVAAAKTRTDVKIAWYLPLAGLPS